MKQIRLIAQDFDSLETEETKTGRGLTSSQYTSPFNCPIARACKRMGFEGVRVSPSYVLHSKGAFNIRGNSEDVGRIAHSIENGAKWGAIKVV